MEFVEAEEVEREDRGAAEEIGSRADSAAKAKSP